MLALSRKTNESIMLGSDIEITVLEVKGDQVKLGIKAPKNVHILRKEIFTGVQDENKKAAESTVSAAAIGELFK